MIATDFVCWLPVIIASCLHSAAVIDATPFYSFISIVFLPINSVINPVVYDQSLSETMETVTHKLLMLFTNMKQLCTQILPEDVIESNQNCDPDVFEMKNLKNPRTNTGAAVHFEESSPNEPSCSATNIVALAEDSSDIKF
jgi:hypothetical protein